MSRKASKSGRRSYFLNSFIVFSIHSLLCSQSVIYASVSSGWAVVVILFSNNSSYCQLRSWKGLRSVLKHRTKFKSRPKLLRQDSTVTWPGIAGLQIVRDFSQESVETSPELKWEWILYLIGPRNMTLNECVCYVASRDAMALYQSACSRVLLPPSGESSKKLMQQPHLRSNKFK